MDQISDFAAAHVSSPPESFNFAVHLMALNADRADKPAFVDDVGSLSYGELETRIRRLASGLRDRGVKREERILMPMQDGTDWPVAFLGAICAGIVPVAVNTLLTADDFAYMLEHSRAQAVLVSGEVLPNQFDGIDPIIGEKLSSNILGEAMRPFGVQHCRPNDT